LRAAGVLPLLSGGEHLDHQRIGDEVLPQTSTAPDLHRTTSPFSTLLVQFLILLFSCVRFYLYTFFFGVLFQFLFKSNSLSYLFGNKQVKMFSPHFRSIMGSSAPSVF